MLSESRRAAVPRGTRGRSAKKARAGFAIAIVAILGGGQLSCGNGGEGSLTQIAKAAVRAEARVASGENLTSVIASDPLASHYTTVLRRDSSHLRQLHHDLQNTQQRLQFRSGHAVQSDGHATVRLAAFLTLREPSGQSGGISEEHYVVALRRIRGEWIVTQICNPSESAPC